MDSSKRQLSSSSSDSDDSNKPNKRLKTEMVRAEGTVAGSSQDNDTDSMATQADTTSPDPNAEDMPYFEPINVPGSSSSSGYNIQFVANERQGIEYPESPYHHVNYVNYSEIGSDRGSHITSGDSDQEESVQNMDDDDDDTMEDSGSSRSARPELPNGYQPSSDSDEDVNNN